MSTVMVAPARRLRRAYGRPEGLRALAAVAIGAGVGALMLPPAANLAGKAFLTAPAVGAAWQWACVLLAGLTGALLLFRAQVEARATGRSASPPETSRGWALVTLACGLALFALIPLRYLAAEGRTPGDPGQALAALLLAAAGATCLLFGLGALLPRPHFRHTDGVPRADAPSTRSVASWPLSSGPLRPAASAQPGPSMSAAALADAALPVASQSMGLAWRTTLAPVRTLGPRGGGPLVAAGASQRSTEAAEMAWPYRLLVLLVGLTPVIWILLKVVKDLLRAS